MFITEKKVRKIVDYNSSMVIRCKANDLQGDIRMLPITQIIKSIIDCLGIEFEYTTDLLVAKKGQKYGK